MRPINLRLLCLPAICALALGSGPLAANPFTPAAAIDAAVASFLGAPAGAPGGAARGVDPQLKLAECEGVIEVDWHGSAGTTLQVRCPSRGWRVFVAVGAVVSDRERNGTGTQSLVQRGETVSLIYEGRGFVLTRQGEALEPGAMNQWIKIRPVGENAKPVRGQVISPGTVRVSAG